MTKPAISRNSATTCCTTFLYAHAAGNAFKDRHLYLPRGCEVPEILMPICEANLDFRQVSMRWDPWVHLIASVYTGHTSAVSMMACFGSAARGDPLNLLANIVMAWNTATMQAIFDRWARRRNGEIPPELIARCAPTRTEGLNMRGISRFPIEL